MRLYILPNLLTTGNLFFGFYSIIASIKGRYEVAAWVLFLAMFMDILDGRVARITNTTSDFGLNYDSLADLVSFGVAPALLTYRWALEPFGRVGWLVAFLFVACGALRLARFNVMVGKDDGGGFLGFPIPAASGLMASYYLFATDKLSFLPQRMLAILAALLMVAAALLMVSRFRYIAFKGGLSRKGSFALVLASVLFVFVVASDPRLFAFLLFFLYFLSGVFTPLFAGRFAFRSQEVRQ